MSEFKEQTGIFPDKDFDTSFMERIIFSLPDTPIESKKDLDCAVMEFSALASKKKEFNKTADKLTEDVNERWMAASQKINEESTAIFEKITKYYAENTSSVTFEKKEDGTEQGIIPLEHSEIIITRNTKDSLKLVPRKEEPVKK